MLTPPRHQYSTRYTGDPGAALDVARTALLAVSFEIQEDSEQNLVAVGPGMHSNRQPELVGASRLHLRVADGQITADAMLGGVARMQRFVWFFPPGLVLSLLLVNAVVGEPTSWVHAAWAVLWLPVAAWMSRALEQKTTRAIDRLVRGMAQARPARRAVG